MGFLHVRGAVDTCLDHSYEHVPDFSPSQLSCERECDCDWRSSVVPSCDNMVVGQASFDCTHILII